MTELEWESRILTSDIVHIALAQCPLNPLPLQGIYFLCLLCFPGGREVELVSYYMELCLCHFFCDIDEADKKVHTR